MTELSPAALAVRDAAEKQADLDFRFASAIAAASLRAAADQVEQKWRGLGHEACQEIRAIAAELESSSPIN